MRSILATVIAVGVLCGASALAGAPVGAGKVYAGSEGESVAVIPLTTQGPKGEKQFLLSVQGTGSEFDGKVMPTRSTRDQGRELHHPVQGRGLLHAEDARDRRPKKYELWVPGTARSSAVAFDEKRTQALKAEDI